jgi:hypothetical protein
MTEIVQQRSQSTFATTYIRLLQTLADKYGSEFKDLRATLRVARQGLSGTNLEKMVVTWNEENAPISSRIADKDEKLFHDSKDDSVPELWKRMHLPEIWKKSSFSAKSKEYMWLYLISLDRSSSKAVSEMQENVENGDDIKPPEGIATTPQFNPFGEGGIEGLQGIAEALSPDVMKKMKNLANDYSTRLESGECKVDDLGFDAILKDVVKMLEKDDISSLMQNMSGLFGKIPPGSEP